MEGNRHDDGDNNVDAPVADFEGTQGKRRIILFSLLAALLLFCIAGGYYEMYIKDDLANESVVEDGSSSLESSSDSPFRFTRKPDESPPVIEKPHRLPDNLDTASAGVVGLEIGGVRIEKESSLLSKIRVSTVAKVVHVMIVLAILVVIISYGIRLGILFAYQDQLGASWLTLTYGTLHLIISSIAAVNIALIGYSLFKNLNRDVYSWLGHWFSYLVGALVAIIFIVDIASYFMPQYFAALHVEVPFETIKTLLGLGDDYPSWINPIIQDGYYYNVYGVYVQLCILLLTGSYVLAVSIKLAFGVHSDVQVTTFLITVVSALMSAVYSFYLLVAPPRKVSFVIQIVYLVITTGGIVYSAYGSLFSWQSLLVILAMFMQLRLCLNLSLTNSSLFWTLISPFYAFENKSHWLL